MQGWGGLGGHTRTHQGQPGRGNAGQSLYCGFQGKAGEAGQAGFGLNSFSGPGVQVLPLEVWDPTLGQSGPKCKSLYRSLLPHRLWIGWFAYQRQDVCCL